MTAPNVVLPPLYVCPSCRKPGSAVRQFLDCVVVTPVDGFRYDKRYLAMLDPGKRTVDLETLHNERFECECGVQFNQPVDLNEPIPEPEPPEDVVRARPAARIAKLARRDHAEC